MQPTIVYLHGFRSSPASVKARQLVAAVEALPARTRPRLHVPSLQFSPRDAVDAVERWVRAEAVSPARDVTFVGSSLGGFYATRLAETLGTRAVLVNPAIRPFADLAGSLGTQTNLYTGETFEVTPRHFDELRGMAVARITQPARYWLLVQTGDDVLDWREAIAHYAGAHQLVEGGGDHGFQRFDRQIPAVLRFAGVGRS